MIGWAWFLIGLFVVSIGSLLIGIWIGEKQKKWDCFIFCRGDGLNIYFKVSACNRQALEKAQSFLERKVGGLKYNPKPPEKVDWDEVIKDL